MGRLRPWMATELEFLSRTYGVGLIECCAWLVLPWIATFVCGGLMWNPATSGFGVWLLLEDHPVEWATTIVAVLGGLRAFAVALQAWRFQPTRKVGLLYLVVAIGLVVFGMEEISWGQRLGHFRTPEALNAVNLQREFNLHNIEILEDSEKYLMVAIGLLGVLMARTSRRRDPLRLRPPLALAGFFSVIFVTMSMHVASYYLPINERLADCVDGLMELDELLLVAAVVLHVHWNGRVMRMERERGHATANPAGVGAVDWPGA